MLGALATTLFFAVTPVFANRAAGLLGSTRANFWRLLVAAIALGAWAQAFGRGGHSHAVTWFVFGGVVGFGVGGLAMFQSLPRLGSNLSTLTVQCGSAIAAATVEWSWLGTRLSVGQLAFVAMTLAGITLGLYPFGSGAGGGGVASSGIGDASTRGEGTAPTSKNTRRAGLRWALLSAVAQGIGAVMSRKAFAVAATWHEAVDPGTAAYLRALGGVAFAAMALVVVAVRRLEPAKARATAVPWVLANALTGPILGVTCYQWALRTTPAGIVQPIVAAAPLLTIPFAAWLEGSRVRGSYYLGAVLAVAGVTGLMLTK